MLVWLLINYKLRLLQGEKHYKERKTCRSSILSVIYRMIRGTISQSYTSIRLIRMNHAQSIRLIILYSDNSFLSLKQQLLNTEYKPPNFHLKDIPWRCIYLEYGRQSFFVYRFLSWLNFKDNLLSQWKEHAYSW